MDPRQNYLSQLHTYIEAVDKEVTLILQSLQWDRKHLLESTPLKTCKYDANHKMPPDKIESHERECFQKLQGYCKEDRMLPEPLDPNSITVIKFTTKDITDIINNAAEKDPGFKKGKGSDGSEPLTDGRLRCAYTADERRAIHDAAVCAAPACHDLSDLALLGNVDDEQKTKPKSRMEVLAELRNMKRRRAKYRVAAKTKNYSDVLRDVIKTQMEFYTEAQGKSQNDSLKKQDTNSNSNNYSEPNAKGFKVVDRKRQTEESIERKDVRSDTNREREQRHYRKTYDRRHYEYLRRDLRQDNQRLSSEKKRDDEITNKKPREYSHKQSETRHHSSDKYERYEISSNRDRFNQKHGSTSRHDRERDEYRSRNERRNDGHSGQGDEHSRHSNKQSKGSDSRYNESRYAYSDRHISKHCRNIENREKSSNNGKSYREIEIKREIKEEYDSGEEHYDEKDTEERSRHRHKKKKHKKHRRGSESRERIIKVKEEFD